MSMCALDPITFSHFWLAPALARARPVRMPSIPGRPSNLSSVRPSPTPANSIPLIVTQDTTPPTITERVYRSHPTCLPTIYEETAVSSTCTCTVAALGSLGGSVTSVPEASTSGLAGIGAGYAQPTASHSRHSFAPFPVMAALHGPGSPHGTALVDPQSTQIVTTNPTAPSSCASVSFAKPNALSSATGPKHIAILAVRLKSLIRVPGRGASGDNWNASVDSPSAASPPSPAAPEESTATSDYASRSSVMDSAASLSSPANTSTTPIPTSPARENYILRTLRGEVKTLSGRGRSHPGRVEGKKRMSDGKLDHVEYLDESED
ncbi:hypothetical protein C8R44DRAFT_732792 [Mycena epipterygia]|nr:hypothetical protein C8R44DRAFT_732792 [Mycena epipterygia]